MAWQPISDPPSVGDRRYLVRVEYSSPRAISIVSVEIGVWRSGECGFLEFDLGERTFIRGYGRGRVTHWQPLPDTTI